jgi:NAD(P)-dependent dehydrogenase (short-subunit alcohol dehydrogenase family)
MNKYDLNGKHLVITGGATGLGLKVAERALDSGAIVSLWDRNQSGLEFAKEFLDNAGRVNLIEVDVSNNESVVKAAKLTAQFGQIDSLINSAGIVGPNCLLVDYRTQDWQEVMNVNINGVFNCCRELVPHILRSSAGRIVNIASVAGKEGNPTASAYSASKAAVIALTKSLGKELAKTNVLVNCVTPTAFKSAMLDVQSKEHVQYMLSKIPQGRFGLPEEVAALVVWLCTADCSFSTGAVFDISGGRSTY